MTTIYIHSKNRIHGLGIAIESDNTGIKQSFIDLCFKYFINDKITNNILGPFYQSGSNNINSNFHYFEMLKINEDNVDILFNLAFKIANELNLELEII